jgi:hypothetical protein
MRKFLAPLVLFVALMIAAPLFAQNPNYDSGPIWRVTYYHLKPGQGDAFWSDFRAHGKPILDEEKKLGLISEYKAFTNPVTDNADDWDVAIATLYPNWAAMDQLDAKATPIVVKHYGSRDAAFEAARKRSEIRDVVASHLAHEVMPK